MVQVYPTPHELTPDRQIFGSLIRSEAFDNLYKYDGPLGAIYQKNCTLFRLWSPLSDKIELVIYEGTAENSLIKEILPMENIEKGVHETSISGDCHGFVYAFQLSFSGEKVVTADPYAKGAIVNGKRSVVIDPATVHLENFQRMPAFSAPTDALIYEMQIRDFSISPNSGIKNKGKYLGVIETGTKTINEFATGLDYLKKTGVTHIEFLPFFDFATVDEADLASHQYNWGYDPLNYNVPEGSYSTDPKNPTTRILELKQMIKGLHDNGLRVIMDVVYNHVFNACDHPFHKTAPGYYFRHHPDGTLANGTGTGNDVASERAMVRKYIVDSVLYWATEFHLDGFRFDLMGNLDIETMQEIREALDTIDRSILIIGEGWDLQTSLPPDKKATEQNADKLLGIGFFNDRLRDAVKGHVFTKTDSGFINGGFAKEKTVINNMLAQLYFPERPYLTPSQLVQYVEVHDNLTLFDKLVLTNPDDTPEQRLKRHMLGTSIPLLSQGIPFIHAGQEFLRTKYGDENSYKSPDKINQIDWEQAAHQIVSRKFFTELVALRKKEPLFRLADYQTIEKHAQVHSAQNNLIAYRLYDLKNDYLIILNSSMTQQKFPLAKLSEFTLLCSNALPEDPVPEENYLLPLSVAIYHRFLD